MILNSIRQPDGETMWVVAILSQSVEENVPSLTTVFEVYAVAATLQAAEDIVWGLRPSLPREEFLALQILEAPLVES
jgi:hypothetical protein